MALELKQSTAVTIQLGPFVDKTDGVTPETGLATAMDNATTGIRISKNGATMVDRNSATVPAHDDDGYYRINLSTTDTNTLGTLLVQYEESATCLPMWREFSVVTANYWDTKYSTDQFDVNVTNIAANTITATAINADAITGAKIAPGAIAKGDQLTGLNDIAATAIVSAGAITTLSGAVVNVDTVDTCTTNSDMRGTDSAALASVCTETRLSELDAVTAGKMANQVDIIQVDTTTDIPATITTLQADTDDIQSRLPAALVGGLMSADVTAISTSTIAADNLEKSTLQIIPGSCEGTPTTTVIQTDLADAGDDVYIGRTVIFTSGAAINEATDITDYTGATGTLTVTALASAPSASDTFIVI